MMLAGGFWGFGVVLIGGFLLGGVILWALFKNRQQPKSEIDRTERATHERILEQDAIDKRRDGQDDTAN